jgi:hypothetical protein
MAATTQDKEIRDFQSAMWFGAVSPARGTVPVGTPEPARHAAAVPDARIVPPAARCASRANCTGVRLCTARHAQVRSYALRCGHASIGLPPRSLAWLSQRRVLVPDAQCRPGINCNA